MNLSNKKQAFAHCRILPGGALDVFIDLIKNDKNIKNAKIFTLTSDREFLDIWNDQKIPIITALPQKVNKLFQYLSFHKIPVLSFFCDYRNLMFFYPRFMKKLSKKIQKYKPDEIIISSFAIAKNLDFFKKKSRLWKIRWKLYLHSPMQYIRSHHSEYQKKLSWIKKFLFKLIVKKLRKRDQKYTEFDEVLFNSKYTQKLAKEIYNIKWIVQYPKIKEEFLEEPITKNVKEYFIYVWRLNKFVKEVDLIINLFNLNKKKLIILWNGPDEKELKQMANSNIVFIDWIDWVYDRIEIMKYARWLINLTKESFGICTAEALALGVPVLGYNDWATPELVDENSGILVDEKNLKELVKKFEEFDKKSFSREEIKINIEKKLKFN